MRNLHWLAIFLSIAATPCPEELLQQNPYVPGPAYPPVIQTSREALGFAEAPVNLNGSKLWIGLVNTRRTEQNVIVRMQPEGEYYYEERTVVLPPYGRRSIAVHTDIPNFYGRFVSLGITVFFSVPGSGIAHLGVWDKDMKHEIIVSPVIVPCAEPF